jgi:hypothetical protein
MEEIVAERGGFKERAQYRLADGLLHRVNRLENVLRPGAGREDLYREFAEMDTKLHELINALDALGPAGKRLQRDAVRLRYADQQLHAALSQGDKSPERGQQVLLRQAQILHATGQDLFTTANYALQGDGNAVGAAQALGNLSQAADQFYTIVEQKADRNNILGGFNTVVQSYQQALQGLATLTPEQNQYLYSRLQRFDQIFDVLYRHLGLPGQRPALR